MYFTKLTLEFFCHFVYPPFITQEVKKTPANQGVDPKQLTITNDGAGWADP